MKLKHLISICLCIPIMALAQCPQTDPAIQQFIDQNEMLTPLESALKILEDYHQQRPDCQWQAQRDRLIRKTDYKDIPYGERNRVCSITKTLLPHYQTRFSALWSLSCENDMCQEEAENLFGDYPFIRINRSNIFLIEDSTQINITTEYEGTESVRYIELKYKALNQLCGDATRKYLFIGEYPKDKNTRINQLIDSFLEPEEKSAKYDGALGASFIKSRYDEAYFVLDHTDNLIYKDPHLLSMREDLYHYTGGAHGNANATLRSFNLEQAQRIMLNQVIKPEYIKEFMAYARDEFKNQQFGEGKQDWKSQDFWFESGKIPSEHKDWSTEDGFYLNNNFALVEGGLLFIYQPYEISPWSRGIPRLYLSLNKIKPYLQEQNFMKNWVHTQT